MTVVQNMNEHKKGKKKGGKRLYQVFLVKMRILLRKVLLDMLVIPTIFLE
jgi:hypothetical protein